MTDSHESLRHSPLDAAHRALGARMVPFGGWDMPIQYAGVLDEHRACREDAVVFDVSHLGTVRVRGEGAHALLQHALTNDLDRIGVGRAQYTHLLDPVDAHVVDDIIVWWVGERDFFVMPNASNTDELMGALEEEAAAVGTGPVDLADITAERAVLAVQGPQARARVAAVDAAFAAVGRFCVEPVTWQGAECIAAGTGYTGEDGIEIHVPVAAATALWDAVLAAGIQPAGLGARDTLRLEAGLPLHGHELGRGITPLQAGLGWVVRFDKGDFRGSVALAVERDRGVARRLRGLVVDGRQPLRAECPIQRDGVTIGATTSGNFSPVLGKGIALGFLPPDVAPGDAVMVEVRGRAVAATVVNPPFVD